MKMNEGRALHVFSSERLSNQLRLIKGCYSGQRNVVSELLRVGAPVEIGPLLTFKTVLSGWLRSRRRRLFLTCRKLFREWECHCVLSVHYPLGASRNSNSLRFVGARNTAIWWRKTQPFCEGNAAILGRKNCYLGDKNTAGNAAFLGWETLLF